MAPTITRQGLELRGPFLRWSDGMDPDSRPGVSAAKDALDALPSRPAWHSDASCSGDPAHYSPIMFPGKGATSADPARTICRGCPVKEECFLDAMRKPHLDHGGIRAGTTQKQRTTLRRRPYQFDQPGDLYGMARVWHNELKKGAR